VARNAPTGDTNLPKLQEAGFWGRSRELWQIERAFVRGTERITISGFGGQGKTYLATEAGRWLQRTGMFEKVCFVDFAGFQGTDALSWAVSVLATVLEQSFIDAEAVRKYLWQSRVKLLVILDNLEVLAGEALRDLLEAAKVWSETGSSVGSSIKVIVTTRDGNLQAAGYESVGTRKHIAMPLRGLSADDAVNYFNALAKLPPEPQIELPERDALKALFERVDFHPLSIGLLARQLKTRRIGELGLRLEKVLDELPDHENKSLRASLQLSLDRLDEKARELLPRLGVFQGGAMEDMLLKVTGLGKVDEDPQIAQLRKLKQALENCDPLEIGRAIGLELPDGMEFPDEFVQQLRQLAEEQSDGITEILEKNPEMKLAEGVDESTWQELKQALVAVGLMTLEHLPNISVPYLKFHPTLAPALWDEGGDPPQPSSLKLRLKRGELVERHRERYYQLSRYLYFEDQKNPYEARAIAMRELPNLLYGVRGALAVETDYAVDFVDNVCKFLNNFGMNKDRQQLTEQTQHLGAVGSEQWFVAQSNLGEQLWQQGQLQAAAEIFSGILGQLGEEPSYRLCLTLNRLGRCFASAGQAAQAAALYRQGIAVGEQLEKTDGVKQQIGALNTDLGTVLRHLGDFGAARSAYERSLEFKRESNDQRGIAVTNGQLGTLAMMEGDRQDALERYQAALKIFQQLNEPASEAVIWHQLGRVFEESQQWEAAEQHYRRSAAIREQQGLIAGNNGAAASWNNLALVCKGAGKLPEAEEWYRKSIDAGRKVDGDLINTANSLNNLANLLQGDPARLPEARQLAEEALAICKTLDPAASEIWKTYELLAQITEKQGDLAQSKEYRRLARASRAAYAGTQYELQKFAQVIVGAVMATVDPEARQQMDERLANLVQRGYGNLVAAIEQIWQGERDEEKLFDGLDQEDSMIIFAILEGINNPDSLQRFLE
jgi:tetratricopeptide (TPR) repeat protein